MIETPAPSTTVSISCTGASLEMVLNQIADQAKLTAAYGEEVKTFPRRLTLDLKNVPVIDAFTAALSGTELRVKFSGQTVLFVRDHRTAPAMMQGGISGKIVDRNTKRPIRGATVMLDEATKGVISDDSGTFRIGKVPAGSHRIRVRMLGYEKVTKAVSVTDGEMTTVDVALSAGVNNLEQIVVTGTVVPTELKAVPNAITIITAKELQERGITRIDQLFRGDVPGLFTKRLGASAVKYTDEVPGTADVSARGSTNLTTSNESIKIYVDGVELANRAYLGLIDPTAIERIEILTGPQASTIYGSNAINGVMQIFTKRGASSRPQLTVSARSAWTQNNVTSAVAPNHTADLALSGVEGRSSYNLGGSWGYTGSWTPGVQEQTLSGFAGERMTFGRLTLDGSLRVYQDRNVSRGVRDNSAEIAGLLAHLGPQFKAGGAAPAPRSGTSTDRAVSGTGTYALASWWSHTVTLGVDQSAAFSTMAGKTYFDPTDTAAYLNRINYSVFNAAYNTTVQVPLTTLARAVVTVGVDESHSANHSVNGSYALVNNAYRPVYTNSWVYGQIQSHEHGGFLQSQLGVWDALFLTYGLRAVYNPNIGRNQNPNLEPRYGVAFSHEFGTVTAKLRASYGTATRPPGVGAKDPAAIYESESDNMKYWGSPYDILANPDLVPASQQGGEGGIEIYLGNRGSLQVTRYNQTVDNLIVAPVVDSLDLLPQWQALYGSGIYWLKQKQNLNVGSVRNQGWEGRGTLNLWRFAATGTYSWTKSRLIGITPKYRNQFPQYSVGAPFYLMPEHTYAVGLTYVRGGTWIAYNVQGQSAWQVDGSAFWRRTGNYDATRLRLYNTRVAFPGTFTEARRGYLLGDLNASHQVTSHIEALLQVNNLTNGYQSEVDPLTPQSGRTTGLGFRLRW